MHVARKQRVETYLDPETVDRMENDYSMSKSEMLRNAVNLYMEEHDE